MTTNPRTRLRIGYELTTPTGRPLASHLPPAPVPGGADPNGDCTATWRAISCLGLIRTGLLDHMADVCGPCLHTLAGLIDSLPGQATIELEPAAAGPPSRAS